MMILGEDVNYFDVYELGWRDGTEGADPWRRAIPQSRGHVKK